MTEIVKQAKSLGYQTATVIAHIMDMDVEAAGNAEKAAWKRYMTLALLAQAKAMDKKKVIEAVFGKGGKPSKTFQNMWSMATAARNTVLGNRTWDDIRTMDMDAARDTVLMSINSHMSSLEVAGKNAYEKVCHLSPSEASAKREADKLAEAESEAEKALKAEADKLAKTEAEANAQAIATSQPDRSPAAAAIGALAEASRDDLMSVAAYVLTKISIEDMELMHEQITAMLVNAQTATPETLAEAA